MWRKLTWSLLALLVIVGTVVWGEFVPVPSQQGVTQCLDEIYDYDVCRVLRMGVQRECCVVYPHHNPRIAYCLVDIYEQRRPPPLPPSIYYTNRRLCGFPTSEACTLLIKLHCPTPPKSEAY